MSDDAKRVRPGLGRGLSALLGDVARDAEGDGAATPNTGFRTLPIGAISPYPDQPRRRFDDAALDELAASIAARGLLQPIVVRPHGRGYQIIAGERRWRAAQRARLHEVPVIVREFDDAATLEVALVENIQRQDLSAIEEAHAFRRLVRDFGHTQEALGRIVHKSRSHIANLLRLLDLPDTVQARIADGSLDMGHARALIGARDPEALAEQVVARRLSVRETEKLARDAKPAAKRSAPRRDDGAGTNADVAALERQLADLLGIEVTIRHGDKGGVLALTYSSLDQLDMLCQRLTGERF